MELGLPTGCSDHGWKQGRSVPEPQEGRCAWRKGDWTSGLSAGAPGAEGRSQCVTVGMKDWAVGRWMRAQRRIRVRSSGPAAGRKLCGVWRLSRRNERRPPLFRHSRPTKGSKKCAAAEQRFNPVHHQRTGRRTPAPAKPTQRGPIRYTPPDARKRTPCLAPLSRSSRPSFGPDPVFITRNLRRQNQPSHGSRPAKRNPGRLHPANFPCRMTAVHSATR